MTNNDELALKVKTYAVNCNDAWLNSEGDDISDSYVKYKDYVELLAERDADKKRIADMQAVVDAAEKLVRCKGRYHSEQNYRSLAALFGVSTPDLPPLDTEARTVSVKLPPKVDSSNLPFAAHSWNSCIDEVTKRLAAAGIKLDVGD